MAETKTTAKKVATPKLTLRKKLLEIQKHVDKFTKDEKAGKMYDYTTGDQVLGKIRPLMNEYGVLLMQEVLDMSNERMDYTTTSFNKFEKKHVTKEKIEMFTSTKQLFTWLDADSDETLEVRWAANGMNDWDKGFGSALTYAERYFLLKFFHVPTDGDDPDVRQGNNVAAPKAAPAKKEDIQWLTQAQFDKAIQADAKGITATLNAFGTETRKMKKDYREELTKRLTELQDMETNGETRQDKLAMEHQPEVVQEDDDDVPF